MARSREAVALRSYQSVRLPSALSLRGGVTCSREPLRTSTKVQHWPCGVYRGVRRLAKLFVVMQHKSSWHSPNHRCVIALHSPGANRETGPTVSPSEKRAAELAFRVQSGIFSESGFSPRHAKLRPIRRISATDLQSFSALETCWRRERDSNPRYPFEYSGFQDRLFQPLTHPSAVI